MAAEGGRKGGRQGSCDPRPAPCGRVCSWPEPWRSPLPGRMLQQRRREAVEAVLTVATSAAAIVAQYARFGEKRGVCLPELQLQLRQPVTSGARQGYTCVKGYDAATDVLAAYCCCRGKKKQVVCLSTSEQSRGSAA